MINETEQFIGYFILGLFCVFGVVVCCVPPSLMSLPPGGGAFQGHQSDLEGNPQDGGNRLNY